jgi:tRNA(Ile)-lysidine synthase
MSKVSVIHQAACALRQAGVGREERLLVAVSGGVDSVVLLDVLLRLQDALGVRLYVAHVHHGLRGKPADRDAAFVVAEAARRNLGASVCRLDPAECRRGESLQAWARAARYACLDAIAAGVRASRIAVAHTMDDQAETVLLHLLRGTGPRGLAGIPPLRHQILRPLLGVSRAEVEAYASARHLTYRTDASNASDAYLRNRVRHHLLPLLAKEYNPQIVASLAALARLMREDESALTEQAASLLAQAGRETGLAMRLSVEALRGAMPAVARRAFQDAFQAVSRGQHALTRRHLEALRRLLVRDTVVPLPGRLEARREAAAIRIGPSAAPAPGTRDKQVGGAESAGGFSIRPGAWTWWPALRCRVRVRRLAAGGRVARRPPWREILSPLLLEAPLTLRRWRPGDRFRPLGMSGEKKLQDFFVDTKVPRSERARIPLLVAGKRIAWVVGRRISEDFCFRGGGPACLVEVEFSRAQRPSGMDS